MAPVYYVVGNAFVSVSWFSAAGNYTVYLAKGQEEKGRITGNLLILYKYPKNTILRKEISI